jgi:hypothetical protein
MPIPTSSAAPPPQSSPTPPAPPQPPTIAGVQTGSPSIDALRLQASSLSDQLSALEQQRRALLAELRVTASGPARAGTLDQLGQINSQIAQVTTDLGSVRAQIAIRQAQVIRQPPPYVRDRRINGDQVAAVSVVFMLVTFLPLSIAFARRIWRRPAAAPRVDDALNPRFDRLEHAIDAIAIEVERISEGQRFVTRVLAERPVQQPRAETVEAGGAALLEGTPARALGAGPAEPIRMAERQPVRQSITPN